MMINVATKGLGEIASDRCVLCRGKSQTKRGKRTRIGGRRHCNKSIFIIKGEDDYFRGVEPAESIVESRGEEGQGKGKNCNPGPFKI